jgi:hypothetical protein
MIAGRVECEDTQAPARFASVFIIPIPVEDAAGKLTSPSVSRHDVAKTNRNGEFSLANVPPGDYFVLAELNGYLSPVWQFDEEDLKNLTPETVKKLTPLLPPVRVEAGKTAHADITLERGASISGTITYEDGTPAIDVVVRLEEAVDNPEAKEPLLGGLVARSTGTSDDLGHYRINGWPGGKYLVSATLPGGTTFSNPMAPVPSSEAPIWYLAQSGSSRIYSEKTFHKKDAKVYTVAPGEDLSGIDIELPLHSLHSITGKVAAQGNQPPVVFGFINLEDVNDRTFNGRTVILADGSFQFLNLPQGTYKLATEGLSDSVPLRSESSPDPATHSYTDATTIVEVMDKDLSDVSIAVPPSPEPAAEEPKPQTPQ